MKIFPKITHLFKNMKIFDIIRLKLYIKIYNYLYTQISKIATKLNNGIHPKHRIMKYHQFFINNIENNSKILDVGCGIGYLTYNLSKKANFIIGIDISKKSIEFAKKNFQSKNISFVYGDILNYNFKEKFDYIILSNVLEHIKERRNLLYKLKSLSKFILIRVPMIDRSWLTLYTKELGLDYRSDKTHFIEYTIDTFKQELNEAKLELISFEIKFGEIWAKVKSY